jgi:hypothetical protein
MAHCLNTSWIFWAELFVKTYFEPCGSYYRRQLYILASWLICHCQSLLSTDLLAPDWRFLWLSEDSTTVNVLLLWHTDRRDIYASLQRLTIINSLSFSTYSRYRYKHFNCCMYEWNQAMILVIVLVIVGLFYLIQPKAWRWQSWTSVMK